MATPSANAAYPVHFDVLYPEGGNRFMILIRWLLALPHYIVLYFLQLIASILVFVAWFILLITGRYPSGMFSFVEGYLRWSMNVSAYVYFHNQYPPFSMNEGDYDPLMFSVTEQDSYSRLSVLFRVFLLIPHIIVLYFLQLAAAVVGLVMVLVVLVTGNYPRGMFNFLVGVGRWTARLNAYAFLLTDKFPPFSMT